MASVLVAVVFAVAAVTKLLQPSSWKSAVDRYGFGAMSGAVAIVVPPLELAIAALCLLGPSRVGAISALVALALFTAVILRTRRARLPCGCFGGTGESDRRTLLLRNGAIAAIAITAALWPDSGVGRPPTGSMLPVVLTAAGMIAAAKVLVATHQAIRR